MTGRGVAFRPLAEMTTKIGSGATPRGGKEAYRAEGIALVRSMNVQDLAFDHDGLAYIDAKQAKLLDNATICRGDVLLNITGASVARCCFAPIDMVGGRVNQHVAIIRPQKDALDGRYLSYVLVSPAFKGQLLSLASVGATREALTKGGLERFEVPAPPLETQRRIAAILGAYDDLIEVNRRRVAVLEEMARGLFEEWFVRFRFPGHESVPIVDPPDGPLVDVQSSGWSKVKVGSVLQKLRRPPKVKRQDYLMDGPIPCIDQGAEFVGGYTDDGDTVISDPLPICVFGDHTRILKFVNFPFASGADGTQLLFPTEPLTPEFLYLSLLNIDLSNQHYARHFKFLKEQEVWLPPRMLIEDFTTRVRPMLAFVQNLRDQSSALAASRDLLLPRLISGQLSVEAAERDLELAA